MTTLVPGLRLVERRLTRFLREPVSIRNALSVIVGGTLAIMVLAALLMRTVDHREYRSLGRALWWSVQTVTTVGYGDVTPRFASGRIVAAAVMLWGVAFLAILTAAITSTFVAHAENGDVMVAFGLAMDKLIQQIKHYKERVQDHRGDPSANGGHRP